MSLRFGLREVDIARRENSVVSWLDFRPHTQGKELADLFSEWTSGPYVYSARMLTQLAIDNLVKQEVVQLTERRVGGIGFYSFSLLDQATAKNINPNTVELAPREVVLLSFMAIRPDEAQNAEELGERLGGQKEPDSWRTEACQGHLAKLGLVNVVEDTPGAYQLPPR